jgi:DNA-binding MarR family transcriptional regulator
MEADGLVERVRCASDGRVFYASLTDAGLARLKQAWPTHLDSVRRRLLDRLDGLDVGALAQVLTRLAAED